MANILNPLAGSKVDGATFTAAECNAVGNALPRCLVNDGQSDLVASSSINGGGTKSMAVAGLTTWSETCSGAMSSTCNSYALACATTLTITASGAGALTIQTTGSGNVAIDSAGNVAISSDGDTTLAPTGDLIAPVAMVLTGAGGHPTRQSAVAFTDVGIRATNMGFDPANHTMSTTAMGAYQLTLTTSKILLELHLSPSCTYTSFKVRMNGSTSGSLPAVLMNFRVYESTVGNASVALGPLATDPSASNAAYVADHEVTVTLTSPPLRPVAGKRYFILSGGHTGGGAAGGSVIFGVKASGSCDRLAAQADDPI